MEQLNKKKFYLNGLALLLGLILSSLCLYFYFSYAERTHKNDFRDVYDGSHTYFHPKIGISLSPNKTTKVQRFKEDKKIIDFSITTDEYGRRIVPHNNNTYDDYAIFLGCSFAMGYGVNDDETIPFFFQKNSSAYRSYIYAYSGYGPQQTLAISESIPLDQQIKEQQGLIIYLWPTGHIDRLLGTPKVINWAKRWPYYKKSDEGKIEYQGFFDTERKLLTELYLKQASLGITDYEFKNEDYQFMCDVLNQAKNNLLSKLPNSKFIVVSQPFWRRKKLYEEISTCLKNYQIPVIDTKDIYKNYDLKKIHIPDDGHPTPLANEILAKEILRALKQVDIAP